MADKFLLFDFTSFFGHSPVQAAMIVLNLILIESMLSVDNALVMGTMVKDLPKEDRGKALRYGIFGAYFFRTVSLLLASYLIKISWLKAAGGIYLLYLTYNYFFSKATKKNESGDIDKKDNFIYKYTVGKIGRLWSTIILVNIMDLAFSIDNVFAAVAYTNNIYLICLGVFIGILAIRFVAQGVIVLLERFPFLSGSAFVIIAVLGIKLILSFLCMEFIQNNLCDALNSERADIFISLITITIFIAPVLTSWLFNFPKRTRNK